jgi:predicted transcriptional regulator
MTAPVMAGKLDKARNTISEAANVLVRAGKIKKEKVREKTSKNIRHYRNYTFVRELREKRGRPNIIFSLAH